MAVIKVTNSKGKINNVINYVTNKEKTDQKLISGKDCRAESALEEMQITKEQFNKTNGRQYIHFVQSFKPDEIKDFNKGHEIGKEWAEQNFKGHEVLIATHLDKKHIHNHFIVNSVNFENGHKFNQSKSQLQKLKDHSDRLCERYGLSVIKEKSKDITIFNQDKYKALEKGNSYILKTGLDVIDSLESSKNKNEFIEKMNSKGYQVNWKQERKYITFTTPEGKKVRNTNLLKTFKEDRFNKENLENELQRDETRETERRTNAAAGTKHESKDGIRKHTSKGEFGEINNTISAVERGIRGDLESNNELNDREVRNDEHQQPGIKPEHERMSERIHQRTKSIDKYFSR